MMTDCLVIVKEIYKINNPYYESFSNMAGKVYFILE
jgi:hypothetical protein